MRARRSPPHDKAPPHFIGLVSPPPAALLALAGLSIGTGIFSSLISNAQDADKNPCVTSMEVAPWDFFLRADDSRPRSGAQHEVALCENSGARSRQEWIRSDSAASMPMCSSGARTETPSLSSCRDPPRRAPLRPEAKLPSPPRLTPSTHPTASAFTASLRTSSSERRGGRMTGSTCSATIETRADLALTKFQMFGWTIVGVLIYLIAFWRVITSNDAPYMTSLPDIDGSLVTLMGISQAAYLTGKAVAGVNAAQPTPVTTPASPPVQPNTSNPPGSLVVPPTAPTTAAPFAANTSGAHSTAMKYRPMRIPSVAAGIALMTVVAPTRAQIVQFRRQRRVRRSDEVFAAAQIPNDQQHGRRSPGI